LLHIKQPGHGLDSSFEGGLFLTFPEFTVKALVGDDDIYLDTTPCCSTSSEDNTTTMNSTSSVPTVQDTSFYCQILQFQEEVDNASSHLDSLLQQLKRYYNTVKTKCQLNFDVPAGFRRTSQHQQSMEYCRQLLATLNTSSNDLCPIAELSPTLPSQDSNITSTLESPSIIELEENTNLPSEPVYSPIIRSVDKPSLSIPQVLTFFEDLLRASVGFRRIDSMKQYLHDLYQHTIRLDSSPADAVLDAGNYATLCKKNRNTTPVKCPMSFGDVIHMDIVFGPEVSIGNIHYGLLFTDRYSPMTYINPLQNLTSDITHQMSAFFAHIGIVPKRLIIDFDLKLIGSKSREYLNSLLIHVNAAPSHHQDKNGLVERHWQTMVCMARIG
jgi:hypothetical protein